VVRTLSPRILKGTVLEMKPTTRGTLAAVMTGVAAAVGAATAAPAAAVDSVPIPVPLNGVEQSLGLKAPSIAGELPCRCRADWRGPGTSRAG
jgi:hypothetical protein